MVQDRGVAENENARCSFCLEWHLLVDCSQFRGRSHKNKIYFLKGKGICFGCLGAGHLRRDCDNVPICGFNSTMWYFGVGC